MDIDHVSFSKIGGAGLVARHLAEAQANMGHSARLLSTIDWDLHREPTTHPMLTIAAASDRYFVQSDESATQFSLYRSSLEVGTRQAIRDDSIVHLHWTNGLMKSSTIKSLLMQGRPVVWTLHDMNPFSGGCHHSRSCTGFRDQCLDCPQVRPLFRKRVAVELSAKILPGEIKNLVIATPSEWLRTQALSSAALRDQNIVCIRNPISAAFFSFKDPIKLRAKFGLDPRAFVAIAVASNLSDSNKNIALAVRSMESAASRSSRPAALLLVGQKGLSFKSESLKIRHLGELGPLALADAFAASDLLLSTSKTESAGMTVIESAACGTPCLVLSNGGGDEFVKNGKVGFLVTSEQEFDRTLGDIVSGGVDVSEMRHLAREAATLHESLAVAKAYIEVYKNLLAIS